MNSSIDKAQGNNNQAKALGSVVDVTSGLPTGSEEVFQPKTVGFEDNRPENITQRRLQGIANNNQQEQITQLRGIIMNSPQAQSAQMDNLQVKQPPIQQKANSKPDQKPNNTGLSDSLKTGMEHLSGMSLDDVKVHFNSNKPAQLQAHAYAQGNNIHVAPGQEKHVPHEAWHVVQQKQGRVKTTMQMKGNVNVNNDTGLEKEADVMGAKAIQKQTPHSGLPSQMIAGFADNKPIQRMLKLDYLAGLLTSNKRLRDLSDYQKDCALYWNTRDKYDELKKDEQIDTILKYSNLDFDLEKDDKGKSPGQTNPLLDLPDFMQDHHEFDLPLPLGIGTLSFRHGHQYVLGTDSNKWISNNITWAGKSKNGKFKYSIHVILLFTDKIDGRWIVDPHVTIRGEYEQLKQTGVAFISDTADKTKAKRDNPEMEATRASYSIGLGKAGRKPGASMGALPPEYTEEIFQPWLLFVKNRAVRLNQLEDEGIQNRRLWLELQPQYAKKMDEKK